MKMFVKLTAAAAILASLPACDMLASRGSGSSEANQADSAGESNSSGKDESASEGNAAAPAAAGGKDPAAGGAAAAPFTGEVTRAYVVGRWTDNNDCSDVTEFTSDSRFITSEGAEGIWSLAGDQLILQGTSRIAMRVEAADANTIVATMPNGTIGRSTRC